MGLGTILGTGAGMILGGPAGAAIGGTLGGGAEEIFSGSGGSESGSGGFWDKAGNLVGGLLGSAAPVVRGAFDYEAQNRQMELNKEIAANNLAFQKETLDYQKGAQEKTWEREDSAIRRRVADLKASGLSPVLAAGSGASTSSPIPVITPQRQGYDVPKFDVGKVLDGIAFMNNFAKTKAETEYIKAQTELSQANSENIRLGNLFNTASYSDRLQNITQELSEKGARTSLAWANQALLAKDLELYKLTNKYPRMQDSSYLGKAMDTLKFLNSDTAKKVWDNVKEVAPKVEKKWQELNKNMGGRPGY